MIIGFIITPHSQSNGVSMSASLRHSRYNPLLTLYHKSAPVMICPIIYLKKTLSIAPPFVYNKSMSKIYISKLAGGALREYLQNHGHTLRVINGHPNVDTPISCHPDIYMCRIGDKTFHGNPELLSSEYPGDAKTRYNTNFHTSQRMSQRLYILQSEKDYSPRRFCERIRYSPNSFPIYVHPVRYGYGDHRALIFRRLIHGNPP